MQGSDISMLALFGLGGGEIILILALILILFGARKLPGLGRGLRTGINEFRRATDDVRVAVDQEAHDAGESLGGIYGKPAAQALTPDNQTAELYDPAVFHNQERTGLATKRMRFRGWGRLWRLIWRFVFKCLSRKI